MSKQEFSRLDCLGRADSVRGFGREVPLNSKTVRRRQVAPQLRSLGCRSKYDYGPKIPYGCVSGLTVNAV